MKHTYYFNTEKEVRTGLEEEVIKELLKEKSEGNLETLLENYFYVIKKLANEWIEKTMNRMNSDDIMQDCILEFCNSYYKYDVESKLHFVSFFKMNIFGYLQNRCTNDYRIVAIPRNAFRTETFKALTKEEKEKAFIRRFKKDNVKAISKHIDPNVDTAEEKNLDKIYYDDIRNTIKGILTEKEYTIVSLRYGFEDDIEKSMEEIGKILNVSKMAISKQLKKIHEKIKTNIALSEKI